MQPIQLKVLSVRWYIVIKPNCSRLEKRQTQAEADHPLDKFKDGNLASLPRK